MSTDEASMAIRFTQEKLLHSNSGEILVLPKGTVCHGLRISENWICFVYDGFAFTAFHLSPDFEELSAVDLLAELVE